MVDVLPELRAADIPAGRTFFRVYDATWGYDEYNPGFGDARFSPIDEPHTGRRIPSLYVAATRAAALLETVFHDLDAAGTGSCVVYEHALRGKLLACVRLPERAVVADLRDAELARLGLARSLLVASPAEHYPCTRRLAVDVLRRWVPSGQLQGLVWNSRQGGQVVAGGDADDDGAEVVVLFGNSYPSGRGEWPLAGPGATSLFDGPGRLMVEEVAEQLGALIELVD